MVLLTDTSAMFGGISIFGCIIIAQWQRSFQQRKKWNSVASYNCFVHVSNSYLLTFLVMLADTGWLALIS